MQPFIDGSNVNDGQWCEESSVCGFYFRIVNVVKGREPRLLALSRKNTIENERIKRDDKNQITQLMVNDLNELYNGFYSEKEMSKPENKRKFYKVYLFLLPMDHMERIEQMCAKGNMAEYNCCQCTTKCPTKITKDNFLDYEKYIKETAEMRDPKQLEWYLDQGSKDLTGKTDKYPIETQKLFTIYPCNCKERKENMRFCFIMKLQQYKDGKFDMFKQMTPDPLHVVEIGIFRKELKHQLQQPEIKAFVEKEGVIHYSKKDNPFISNQKLEELLKIRDCLVGADVGEEEKKKKLLDLIDNIQMWKKFVWNIQPKHTRQGDFHKIKTMLDNYCIQLELYSLNKKKNLLKENQEKEEKKLKKLEQKKEKEERKQQKLREKKEKEERKQQKAKEKDASQEKNATLEFPKAKETKMVPKPVVDTSEKESKDKKAQKAVFIKPHPVYHEKNHLSEALELTNGELSVLHCGPFEQFHGDVKNEKLEVFLLTLIFLEFPEM